MPDTEIALEFPIEFMLTIESLVSDILHGFQKTGGTENYSEMIDAASALYAMRQAGRTADEQIMIFPLEVMYFFVILQRFLDAAKGGGRDTKDFALTSGFGPKSLN